MRNSKKILASFLILNILVGCDFKKEESIKKQENKVAAQDNLNSANGNNSKDSKVSKVSFIIANDGDLPENMINSIKSMKSNRGYILYDYEGYYYISIFLGEKNTAGYNIKVLSVEDNDGKVNILIEETSPSEGSFTAQVITYPYVTIKVKGIAANVAVKNDEGENFTRILQDGEIY